MTSNATADRPCPDVRLGLHRRPAHVDGDLPLRAGNELFVATAQRVEDAHSPGDGTGGPGTGQRRQAAWPSYRALRRPITSGGAARPHVTTATAAIPSSRPIEPMWSVVVAFTETTSIGNAEHVGKVERRIESRCGATRTDWAMTVTSTCATSHPSLPVSRTTSDEQQHRVGTLPPGVARGEQLRRCPPDAAAPNRASATAWAATSPSEVRHQPAVGIDHDPGEDDGGIPPKRWASKPQPTRREVSSPLPSPPWAAPCRDAGSPPPRRPRGRSGAR